jgi:hypothetical protein
MANPLSEAAYPSTPRSGAGRTIVTIPLKELGDYHCKPIFIPFQPWKFHAYQPRIYV